MTRLRSGDLEAELAGGDLLSVTSLRLDGRELLVGPRALADAYRVHGRRAGLTLLHPWANRLGADTYTVVGIEGRLRPGAVGITRDENGLAIHGLATPGTWLLPESDGGDEMVVEADIAPDEAFPFAHRLAVSFRLYPARLQVGCHLTATGGVPVPLAFGWHPYLDVGGDRARWEVSLPDRAQLELDGRGLPTGVARERPAEAFALDDRSFDDGYEEIEPGSVLAVTGTRARVSVVLESGYTAAQLFAPSEIDVVALEPMTCPADGLHSGRGLRMVAPGATAQAVFRLDVEPVEER